ncbi:hypothetical protein [Pantoea agglomerans]|uniref:hypothetical protein n=1 Tax=Enterobacter agglomerans TaxID=549 RepID=UPI0004D80211|nr:hypothetical protein [Pantoea agglomerans]KEY40000.1 hypothetical protein FB99_46060 [Pantoea agglomerans]
MPTKHIDENTAADLDELYVRCVTLTQQPVKEVEVLRLAIQKGINNIADDDILAAMSVKDTVWKALAKKVWSEVTAWWPEDAVFGERFEKLAAEYSETWQQLPSENCRLALRSHLGTKIVEPVFGTYSDLFEADDLGMTAEDRKESVERDKRLDADYRASLTLLQDRLYSSLTTREQTLARHYSDRVSFTPDGQGDFVVQVTEAAQ